MLSDDAVELLERVTRRGKISLDDFMFAWELALQNPADCHHLNRRLGHIQTPVPRPQFKFKPPARSHKPRA